MIKTIYIIILIYFILGGVGFYFINRKKDAETARNSYIKFITYFFIINILFFSIVLAPTLFQLLLLFIITISAFELFNLFKKGGFNKKKVFYTSFLIFLVLSVALFGFSRLSSEVILFSFLILSIFDSFSQISGQLFGKTKIALSVSPNKTAEGVAGGAIIAFISSFLLKGLYQGELINLVVITAGILLFAFAGDLAASYYKRVFGVKDFSSAIPGHGGFLDRFDSLIAGGAWVGFSIYLLGL
ncbi:phosphatidate cytidylyltransferase [Marinilabiliaceae bacterium ANBcel2]|nr:phosphatidate cytidylyltransferase [Marinilabiliaceae bacterium ANBcel2]